METIAETNPKRELDTKEHASVQTEYDSER